MSLEHVRADVPCRCGRACVLGLVLVFLSLVPVAHAIPSDSLWIAGVYDDGDFDEAVMAVVSATGLIAVPVVPSEPTDISAETVRPPDLVVGGAPLASSFSIRAPPSGSLSAATP